VKELELTRSGGHLAVASHGSGISLPAG